MPEYHCWDDPAGITIEADRPKGDRREAVHSKGWFEQNIDWEAYIHCSPGIR